MSNPKKLVLMTKGRENQYFLTGQLNDLIGDMVSIKGISIDEPFSPTQLDCDLLVLSSGAIYEQIMPHLDRKNVIVARRAINYAFVDKLLSIPPKTKAMVVNVSKEASEEVVSLLYSMGFRDLWLIPVYPGLKSIPNVDIAITPGEKALVPPGARVVDIGTRTIDVTTMTEILICLNLLDEKANILSAKYMNQIIEMGKRLSISLSENRELNTLLETIINKVHDGIVAVGSDGRVILCNQVAQKLAAVESDRIMNSRAVEVFPGLNADRPLETGNSEENSIETYQNKELIVNRMVFGEVDQVGGSVLTFKEIEQLEQMEHTLRRHLKKKGHVAKYRFKDLAGVSQAIKKALQHAQKFAATDLTILFLGETGTGKELFASAVHNASRRCNQPFVAVNCAALPRDLLESELFGYEEGAFTGAKRGGKAGLFEMAHLGTIFLDEIGEIPLATQAKLLRVLEEKEVMRLGSEMVIPVNVRVIAATNRDLRELVENGGFRKDLYYRLNVVTISLPSLRERPDDVIAIADSFLKPFNLSASTFLGTAVQIFFRQYNWPGNLRELKNVLEFLSIAVTGRKVELADLPRDLHHYQPEPVALQAPVARPNGQRDIRREEELAILNMLAQQDDRSLGRKRIVQFLRQCGYDLTEDMVRARLESLKVQGLVEVGRGRRGTSITRRGRQMLTTESLGTV